RILKRHTDEVVLCFDSDTAGLNAASKAFRVLAPEGILVRLALLPEGEDPDSLIRSQGIGALEEILSSPPEFFDFHIDRRGSALTQGPLRDRLNFAKDLAADIALVDDKMLQDSLISRVTVRLGVGEDDIRKLVRNAAVSKERIEKAQLRRENLSRQRESASPEGGQPPPGSAPVDPQTESSPEEISNRSVRLLCKALLSDAEIRQHIVQHSVPEYFEFLGETELLTRIWRAEIDPGNPASVNAFIGGLNPGDQNHAVRMMMEEGATITLDLASECLKKLKKLSIQNQIAGIKAKLGTPDLPHEAVVLLNKQLLDLRAQLHES
ncbi:MAG: toprim domain-containing protein, partial [Verrucomicrobiota bacterium]